MKSDLLLANAEALANSNESTPAYKREEGDCVIDVGAKGKIKLFGGTILEADATGKISFTGKVVCRGKEIFLVSQLSVLICMKSNKLNEK